MESQLEAPSKELRTLATHPDGEVPACREADEVGGSNARTASVLREAEAVPAPVQRAVATQAAAAGRVSPLHLAMLQRQKAVQRQMTSVDAPMSVAEPSSGEEESLTCEPEPLWQFTHDGQTYELTEAEWGEFRVELVQRMRRELGLEIRQKAQEARGLYDHFVDLNDDQYIVAFFVEVLSGADLPDEGVIIDAEAAAQSCHEGLVGHDLEAATALVRESEAKVNTAVNAMREYREQVIGGGGTAITILEVTKTGCFAIAAVAGGAVLAAPAAAGGLGMGLMGSGAISTGGAALLQSSAEQYGRATFGGEDITLGGAVEEIAWDTAFGAASGAIGGLANRLLPGVTDAVFARMPPSVVSRFGEEAVRATIQNMLEGSFSNVVAGAIQDGVGVVRGKDVSIQDFCLHVATNLIAGGFAGAVQGRLRTHRGGSRQIQGSGAEMMPAW